MTLDSPLAPNSPSPFRAGRAAEGWGEGALNLNTTAAGKPHSRASSLLRESTYAAKAAQRIPKCSRGRFQVAGNAWSVTVGIFFLSAGSRMVTGLQLALVLSDDSRCA